jgi:predicted porin
LLLANGFEGLTTLGGGSSSSISRSGGFTSYANGITGTQAGNGSPNVPCSNSLNYDARYGNSVRYDSPSFSGLTIATHYAFLGENSVGNKCKGWDTKVDYNNGPITAAIAYSRHIDFPQYDGNAWVAHAAYDFGVAKIEGQYQRMKYDGNNGSNGSATANYWHAGVQVPIGPGTLSAQYHKRNKGVTTSATTVAEVTNGGGKAYSVSYMYGFSKRTYVYGWAARVNADNGARIEGGPLGGKATSLGFGVRHNF